MSKKFKGQLKKDIEVIVKQLPPAYYTANHWWKAEQLLNPKDDRAKAAREAVISKYTTIDPKKQYEVAESHPINHESRIKDAFKRGGRKAVIEYILPYSVGETKQVLEEELKQYTNGKK